MVRNITRLEGLIIFLFSLYLFNLVGGGQWLYFFLFLFVPDISMLGYLKDKKLGAFLYNLGHNLILAFILTVLGVCLQNYIVFYAGIIVAAHVGLDRFLGFGLKYPSGFKNTHIQRL